MKICNIISQDKLRSGSGIQMYRLSKKLAESPYNFDVYAVYGKSDDYKDDFKVFNNTNVKLKFFDFQKLKFNLKSLRLIIQLRNFIKKEKFDVIHCHNSVAYDYIFFATLFMKTVIILNRGVSKKLNFYNSLKYKSKKLNRIFAISQYVKNILIKSGKILKEKIDVILGMVNINEFNPLVESSLRKELNIPDDKIIIGYLGNESRIKGPEYLIEAFNILKKKYNNIVLVMAGISREFLEKRNISKEDIYPLGFRRDTQNCLRGYDIFVFSGIGEEGLGMVIAEAAACGIPIVTTNSGGTVEIIKDKYNGIVVNPKDSQALADGIEYLLINKEEREKFVKNGLDFIENNMSENVIVDKIVKIYKEEVEKCLS